MPQAAPASKPPKQSAKHRSNPSAGTPPDHPGVKFPPPLLFFGGLALGYLVQRRFPAGWIPSSLQPARFSGGWGLVALGLALGAWGFFTFLWVRTAILPHHPASRMVVVGPYRFTRNPMYVGLTGLYLGVTVLMDSLWPLLLLPAVLVALYLFVIRREERYLAARFGAEYEDYRRRVRRWF